MGSALHILNIDEKNDARTELDQHDAMLVALQYATQHTVTDWCVVRGGKGYGLMYLQGWVCGCVWVSRYKPNDRPHARPS